MPTSCTSIWRWATSYFAGRTRRISLGTSVIVLPWHDPVRVAEQIALLDIMCGGRCLFGFGRGAASTEYEGFRVPMGKARPRFAEAAEIVVKALSQESFEHDGAFFKIPRMSIRPRPTRSRHAPGRERPPRS
jgi:alkanesulfonate monooxygenase SsuD/methylene tetrahydromethanopterin reductase-like flavin-dependent oxidoreductase (luciferase family)